MKPSTGTTLFMSLSVMAYAPSSWQPAADPDGRPQTSLPNRLSCLLRHAGAANSIRPEYGEFGGYDHFARLMTRHSVVRRSASKQERRLHNGGPWPASRLET